MHVTQRLIAAPLKGKGQKSWARWFQKLECILSLLDHEKYVLTEDVFKVLIETGATVRREESPTLTPQTLFNPSPVTVLYVGSFSRRGSRFAFQINLQ